MQNILPAIKRNLYAAAALALVVSAALPAILTPLTANAAQVTARNIKMSTAAPSTTAQYEINFTTGSTATIQGVVIDFCSQSPIVGHGTCTIPSGMTVGSTVSSQTGLTAGTWAGSTAQAGGSKTLVLTNASGGSVSTGTNVSITMTGFTNPSTVGTFYARILTYSTATAANAYTSDTTGTYVDYGGVALSTTNSVSVTALVQESLTFCVSAVAPTSGCGGATTPSITLGHGGPPATIDPTAVDTANVFYQVSTNAQNATTIRMKGSANLSSGANTIPGVGATAAPIVAGTAAFGMKSTNGAPIAGGTGATTAVSPYNHATNYALDSATANDNVTATYGDTIASNASGALKDVNGTLVFAATAGATTPAGIYTANYSLIATSSY